jgi:Cd2+/Zn2+-exporting ATPase
MLKGELFDENFLMSIATIGAIAIHELPEAAAVMLFYAIGEGFQERAVNRSRRSIEALLRIQPTTANLKTPDGIKEVNPETVAIGDLILIRPGEKVPLDGEVTDGKSFLDTSALTGESVPRKTEVGATVLAGMVNGQGLLTVRVIRSYNDSSVAKILQLVEKASERKAPTEQFITKFARYYTPAMVIGAAAVTFIPPLFIPGATVLEWFKRALVLLVISCPCALMVSIPLGYFGGIGGASRRGILVKGANFLDALANLHTVVFDKTGTLTRGVFQVASIKTFNGFTEDEVLQAAAAVETHSNHPIAHSIRAACEGKTANRLICEYQEIPGHGVCAVIGDQQIMAGNDRLLHHQDIAHEVCCTEGTNVQVVIDRQLAGTILISDELKEDAETAIAKLKSLGIRRTVLLTGDEAHAARQIAESVGIDEFHANLLPEQKVEMLETIETSIPDRRRNKMAFVGDGINDAPVITRADIGIAMGALGSDAAIEAADVVLMEDSPAKLAAAVAIARQTRRIAWQNIAFALGVKAIFLAMGVVGVANIWEAVFADVGVALLAVLNASRALRVKG